MTVLAERPMIGKAADGELDVAGWNAANPLHPRAGDGKFRDRLASAVHAIAESWGEIVARHEVGEPDHPLSDHGVVSMHDDAGISISRINDDGSIGHVASGLGSDDASVLRDRMEMALDELDKDLPPGTHLDMDDDDLDDPFPVSVGYGVMSDGTKYVALTDQSIDPDAAEGLQLSHEHARDVTELLATLRDQQFAYERDVDNPYVVRPLPDDETLLQRKKVTSEDHDDVLLGIVDTAAGRRLRLGLGGHDALPEKSFTGGPGPMVADLGPDEARLLDKVIKDVLDEAKSYHEVQQEAADVDEAWGESPSGERLSELYAEYDTYYSGPPGPGGDSMRVMLRGPSGERVPESQRVEAPPEVYAEIRTRQAEREDALAAYDLVDEGEDIGSYEVETPGGTVVVTLRGWDPSTKPDFTVGVRPHGVSADDENWDDIRNSYEAYAQMTAAQLKKLGKLTREAFMDAQGQPMAKSASGTARRADNGRIAREGRHYWTRTKDGLDKWARKAHPWRSLYRHLVTKMNPETAARLTSSYFKAVFGYAPSARQGKNPVGKG